MHLKMQTNLWRQKDLYHMSLDMTCLYLYTFIMFINILHVTLTRLEKLIDLHVNNENILADVWIMEQLRRKQTRVTLPRTRHRSSRIAEEVYVQVGPWLKRYVIFTAVGLSSVWFVLSWKNFSRKYMYKVKSLTDFHPQDFFSSQKAVFLYNICCSY